jgi:hypothetical protein
MLKMNMIKKKLSKKSKRSFLGPPAASVGAPATSVGAPAALVGAPNNTY